MRATHADGATEYHLPEGIQPPRPRHIEPDRVAVAPKVSCTGWPEYRATRPGVSTAKSLPNARTRPTMRANPVRFFVQQAFVPAPAGRSDALAAQSPQTVTTNAQGAAPAAPVAPLATAAADLAVANPDAGLPPPPPRAPELPEVTAGVAAPLRPPCIFHGRFSVQHTQAGVGVKLRSAASPTRCQRMAWPRRRCRSGRATEAGCSQAGGTSSRGR